MLTADLEPPALKLTGVVLGHMKNAKTGLLNPSMATVAARVGISPSQAQRYVRELKALGIVSVAANAYGGKPGTTPSYRLHLDRLKTGSTDAAPTGRADAAPTDSADAVPCDGETGSTHAGEGQHGCGGGAAPMRPTGSTHAALTGMNRKRTGREPGLQMALEDCSPADAGSQPPQPAGKRSKKVKAVAPTAATWTAYAEGFRKRYGIDPVRNAKVNGQLASMVGRLGAEEAPRVAAFYVAHDGAYYAQKAHSIDAMLVDAEKLRVEMLTGRRMPEQNRNGGASRGPSRHSGFEGKNYHEGIADGIPAA